MTITNDNGGQPNTQVEAAAGETGETDQDTEDVGGAATDVVDDQDDDDQDDDQTGGRRNREAGYRRRAQAAETERDQLRGQLDTLHRQIVGDIATGAGLPEVELLEYAGHELASFITEEGIVDRAKVIEATTATLRRYNIRPGKPPRPNMQQGAYGVAAKTGGVAGVIQEALGR